MRISFSTNPEAITSESIKTEVLEVAQNICEKSTRDLDELIDDPKAFAELVSDEEWRILCGGKPK